MGSVDLDCHWRGLQHCHGGALRSLRLGALGGVTLTYPSNTAAPTPSIQVRRSPTLDGSHRRAPRSRVLNARRNLDPVKLRPGPNVLADLEPVRITERLAGYRSLSGAPLCREPIRTHKFSQMLRAVYGTLCPFAALRRPRPVTGLLLPCQ